jgi:hypothetical protein
LLSHPSTALSAAEVAALFRSAGVSDAAAVRVRSLLTDPGALN